MPIPKPKKDEEQDEFISRCMSNDTMQEDYPDQDQRLAVCFSAWRKDKEEDSANRKVERRYFDPDIELREENGVRKLIGHFAPFNKLSQDLGGYREKIAPGCFLNTIMEAESNRNNPIYSLWNHNSDKPLASTANPYPEISSLHLFEDEVGGVYEMILGDTTWCRDAYVAVKEKLVRHNSFAFQPEDEEWDDGKKVRTLKRVKLFDVSPVTYPAYPQTDIKVRMDEVDKQDIVDRIIEGSQLKSAKLGIQGAEDIPGRVDSLDIPRRKLEIAEKI